MQRRLALQSLALAGSALALPALAQARPIRLIVPYPPGGPLDIVARSLADKVKDTLGVVIVENKPGAGGNLGADAVAKSAPDGTSIVMGAVATHAINPWLYAKLPYDPIRDFTPITGVAQVPNVLVMNPDTAARLNQGRQAAGARDDHRQAFQRDAGRADCRRNRSVAGALRRQHLVRPVRPGQVAGRRDPAAEQDLRRCAEFTGLKARLAALLAEPIAGTPQQFGAFVKSELAKYEGVVKASGAKID